MYNILLVNCGKRQCGVYEFGLNMWKCLKVGQGKHNITYEEHDSKQSILNRGLDGIDLVIWNHHPVTTPWIDSELTDKTASAFILHDHRVYWPGLFVLHCDPTFQESGRDFRIGRPILPPMMLQPDVIPNSIGSFGFGFSCKGFDDLIKKVNDEYDTAVIRLNIPYNTSVDHDGTNARKTAERCFSFAKPGVSCYITHDYMTDDQLTYWLAQNELNAFLYKENNSQGIASTIDWAIRARRPFVVSSHSMFRHVHSVPVGTESGFKKIVKNGIEALSGFYENWTPNNLHADIERFAPVMINKFRRISDNLRS